MHSFQPSRGRILFEFACALGMVASLVGAWRQTGASALLVGASVAGLYGFIRLLDLSHRKPAEAAEPQRIEFEPETADIVVPMVLVEEEPVIEKAAAEAEIVELTTARAGSGRRTGGSRKGGGRRAKTPKAEKVVEAEQVEEVEAPWPVADAPPLPDDAPEMADDAPKMEEEEFIFPDDDQPSQPHIAPLFEPEPYARMQRRAFGRRGRL